MYYHAQDCPPDESTLESRRHRKIVTARKERNDTVNGQTVPYIRKGDKICVTTYFTYEINGPRLSYYRTYSRVSKGPNW